MVLTLIGCILSVLQFVLMYFLPFPKVAQIIFQIVFGIVAVGCAVQLYLHWLFDWSW